MGQRCELVRLFSVYLVFFFFVGKGVGTVLGMKPWVLGILSECITAPSVGLLTFTSWMSILGKVCLHTGYLHLYALLTS